MGKVVTGANMSLDGYIAGPEESGFEHLFRWLDNGEVEVPTARPDMTLRMTPESAQLWRNLMARTGTPRSPSSPRASRRRRNRPGRWPATGTSR